MGHGKAVLDVQLHGDEGREEIILSACRHCTLFDHQFEEGKGWFLSELLIATGQVEAYLALLTASVIRGRRNLDQWSDMLAHLAKRGCLVAQEYLRENWKSALDLDQIWLACSYVETRGEEAYREVLEHAQVLWRNRRKVVGDAYYIHSSARKRIGEKRAKRVRDSISVINPQFARIAEFPESWEPNPERVASWEARRNQPIEKQILEGRGVYRKDLSTGEIDTVARLLQTDLEPKSARAALRIFLDRPFPGNLAVLRTWVENSDEGLSCLALKALGVNRSASIRELAFTWCDDDYKRSGAIAVLIGNFMPGDEGWIEEQIRKTRNQDSFHHEVFSALDVLNANAKGGWTSLLRYVLDTVHCQLCRGSVASQLQVRRALTDADVEALCFDANTRNRRQALKIQRRRSKARASLPQSPEFQPLGA
jgi:hypothetical protein